MSRWCQWCRWSIVDTDVGLKSQRINCLDTIQGLQAQQVEASKEHLTSGLADEQAGIHLRNANNTIVDVKGRKKRAQIVAVFGKPMKVKLAQHGFNSIRELQHMEHQRTLAIRAKLQLGAGDVADDLTGLALDGQNT